MINTIKNIITRVLIRISKNKIIAEFLPSVFFGFVALFVGIGAVKLVSRYNSNTLILYATFELAIFFIVDIYIGILIYYFRSRSIILKNNYIHSIILLITIGGLIFFLIKDPCHNTELSLSFLALIIGLPTITEFMTKSKGYWSILIYPKTKDVEPMYNGRIPKLILDKRSEFDFNIRNLKNTEASISFFGIFNNQQFKKFKKNTYRWRADFLLDNYLNVDCIKRIESTYEHVSAFDQSSTNNIVFIPAKPNSNKFFIQINNDRYPTPIKLTNKGIHTGIILHIVYIDIFNKIYDYPLFVKIK